MSLSDWAKNSWIVEHETNPEEIRLLLRVTDRDLSDCRVSSVSEDNRFGMAYHAALQAAEAALCAEGYRTPKGGNHYRVIQSLELTIEADGDLVQQFDAFRKKRNISTYDRPGTISEKEVQEMIALAEKLREEVRRWLKEKHPELMKGSERQ